MLFRSWMLSQFMEFTNFVKAFGMNLNIKVHGDGLISHLIKSGCEAAKIEE